MDCCRHPDYEPVPTSHIWSTLRGWLTHLQARVRRLSMRRHQPIPQASSAELDAWETRPLVPTGGGRTDDSEDIETDAAADAARHQTIGVGR
jgi:hypothetical protein